MRTTGYPTRSWEHINLPPSGITLLHRHDQAVARTEETVCFTQSRRIERDSNGHPALAPRGATTQGIGPQLGELQQLIKRLIPINRSSFQGGKPSEGVAYDYNIAGLRISTLFDNNNCSGKQQGIKATSR